MVDGDNEGPGTPTLPADHAFVVQFRAGTAAPGVGVGRAEHLVTGVAANFGSWRELRQFVDRVLGGADAALDAD